ncbi:ThiF family adenylyltransferase [Pseudofrankia asymbiotica]|uniref:Molybdopterin biosynthesis protein MoeB n=1 Tax=Pseudofrankia asymbiotica TaxID=1834516 RepID=A0A1V2I8R7_9ACTN|nr:ThiF family adenylyltransferase [Pseudofrankia asymbiotica]ONH28813.1 molybdopterin biosynthesis protein MoeB [Pseudofrankia asymbiotica]
MPENKVIKHRGRYDDGFYWERVDRNLGWLGDSRDEQRARQEKLRESVIGIAGTGGIGGSSTLRFVRMGVRNLKLADSDSFDVSNIQRQVGADLDHLGRNKAEVVGEMAFELTRDVNIDVFPDGITAENADEFVQGCDVILDQIDVYTVDAHYALHEAFRRSTRARFILTVLTIGHAAYVFKYTRDSMPVEEVYGLPPGAELDEKNLRQLIQRFMPVRPDLVSDEAFDEWWIENRTIPIYGGTPPLCEGVLVERTALEIMDIPGVVPLPVQPGYAIFDARTWTTRTFSGTWW